MRVLPQESLITATNDDKTYILLTLQKLRHIGLGRAKSKQIYSKRTV